MTDTKRLREFAEKAIEAAARAIADHFCEDGDDGFRACVKEHCACRKAAVAARDAYEAAMWRPIEEAPKDQRVMVWSPIWQGCVTFAKFDPDKYAKKPRPHWSLENDLGQKGLSRDNQPTHFRPLPPPPKE